MNSLKILSFVILFHIIYIECSNCPNNCYNDEKVYHHLRGVSGNEIESLYQAVSMKSSLKSIFNKINVIRPIGSENHANVRKFISDFMIKLGWQIDYDEFIDDTVIGKVKFTNIIATQNPSIERKLILACHYESKMMDGFYGSIDSAMPCSMIMSAAELLSDLLKQSKVNVSLQLVFFDGEEAFKSWSDYDSIYGSRHLAKIWSKTIDSCGCSVLSKIDTLVLLDLLGAKNTMLYNFNYNNMKLYDSFHRIEKRILFQNRKKSFDKEMFSAQTTNGMIGDDHVPFLSKSVPVLHLIPSTFPDQWHRITDNADNIDWDESSDFELILVTFIAEYFHLPIISQSHLTNG